MVVSVYYYFGRLRGGRRGLTTGWVGMEGRASGRAAAATGTGFEILLAASAGLSVANVYYAQPLLAQIGAALHVGTGELGLATTGTQVGYLLGLVLIVPLGDRVAAGP